jgi:hypothetical protein
MIITFLITLFLTIFTWVFSFLPMAVLNSDITDIFEVATQAMSFMWQIAPISDLLVIIGLVSSLEISIMTYHLASLIYNKVRGSGG